MKKPVVSKTDVLTKDIRTLSFEARYDTAFLLWDNAGKIWSEIQKEFPEYQEIQAKPNVTKCSFSNEFEVGVEIKKFYIIWHKNKKDIKEFFDVCQKVTAICNKHLKIDTYTRVGTRQISLEITETVEDAAKKMMDYGVIKKQDGEFFKVKGKVNFPELSLRWEDDTIGVMVKVGAQENHFRMEAPMEIQKYIEPLEEKKIPAIAYDIDYYTKKNVGVGQFEVVTWIKQAKEIVDADIKRFISVNQ